MAAVLTDYQRSTLIVQVTHWGDEMYRLLQEREKRGVLSDEMRTWMGDQISGWYELARVLTTKQTVK